MRYVALLRGINVGGNNLIPMRALKACFEEQGFANVATYIASGNVLFDSAKPPSVASIESALAAEFDYEAAVVVRSRKQLAAIVQAAPEGFGKDPAKYRYDVLFLKDPLLAAAALKDVPVREGVDTAHAGPGALYFSRLVAKAAQSKLSKIVGTPIYRSMTIRNWNTTTKLLELVASSGRAQ